jgi:hypothetical protein
MGGDPMEVYFCLHYIGLGQKLLRYFPHIFIQSFCNAYLYRPSRTESLYEIVKYYTDSRNYFLGYLTAKQLIAIPPTEDMLYVESWIGDWGALLAFFVCANHLGKRDEARGALKKVLKNPRLPINVLKDYQLDGWAHQFSII